MGLGGLELRPHSNQLPPQSASSNKLHHAHRAASVCDRHGRSRVAGFAPHCIDTGPACNKNGRAPSPVLIVQASLLHHADGNFDATGTEIQIQ
jgi:hypothetical protein